MNLLRTFMTAGCLALAINASGLEVGQPAPPLALPDTAGKPVNLDDFRGKVVYVDFWASWCGPCRHSFPWMNEMHDKYGPQGFAVLGVNLDEEASDAAGFLAKVPARFPIVYDKTGQTPTAYGVKGMPTSVLVGRDGKVLFQHIGFTKAGSAGLEEAIAAAVSAAP